MKEKLKKRALLLPVCMFAFMTLNLFGDNLRPIPWVTKDAVAFLEQYMIEHPDASILEFGAGASTVWFSKRTEHLVSVEHNLDWYNKVSQIIKTNPNCFPINLIYHERPYGVICESFPEESFDLVLVDGRDRVDCVKRAISVLKTGGILMLDNAERARYEEAINELKGWDAVITVQNQPDSCGFYYKNWQTHWYIKP